MKKDEKSLESDKNYGEHKRNKEAGKNNREC
jgi:hypothetical protein